MSLAFFCFTTRKPVLPPRPVACACPRRVHAPMHPWRPKLPNSPLSFRTTHRTQSTAPPPPRHPRADAAGAAPSARCGRFSECCTNVMKKQCRVAAHTSSLLPSRRPGTVAVCSRATVHACDGQVRGRREGGTEGGEGVSQ